MLLISAQLVGGAVGGVVIVILIILVIVVLIVLFLLNRKSKCLLQLCTDSGPAVLYEALKCKTLCACMQCRILSTININIKRALLKLMRVKN